MTICKQCVHYLVCMHYDPNRAECKQFKDGTKCVEMVRCGECLYYSETTGKDSGKPCGYGVCTKPFHITNIVTKDDFCSYGERKDNERKAD